MISLSVLFVALGVLAGLARGGKVGNITISRFRFSLFVFAGLALQTGAELYSVILAPGPQEASNAIAILIGSYAALLLFVLANIKLPGMLLLALGLLLNVSVITVNDGMPVSIPAARAAGFDPSEHLRTSVKHKVLDSSTRLPFLADVIPLPGLRKVISVGDVVFGTGIFFLVEHLVRYQPKRLRPETRALKEAESET